MELGSLSSSSSTSDVDETTEKNKQTSLLYDELQNFAEGQANRIAALVKNGANPKHRYDDDDNGRNALTTLHVLFDAFAESEEDDETKQRSCVECKNRARSGMRMRVFLNLIKLKCSE